MATSTPRTATTVQTAIQSVASKNSEPEDDLLTDIFTAYCQARQNKRNTPAQVRFERNLPFNLMELYEEIRSGRYKVGRSMCFIVTNGKVRREVFAASFRDRIAHHLLFNYLNPVLDPTFIEDSYSCRKGKGTLYGARRLHKHMCECLSESGGPAYVLKLDIRSYFMNINRCLLYDMVVSRLKEAGRPDPLMLQLLSKVIFNDPTRGCRRKGRVSDWKGLPAGKSLFNAPAGCGLPIGNLTSQLFSNVYLSQLDDYVTTCLGIRRYGRYVDDFYLVDSDRSRLLSLIPEIRSFLSGRLSLELHPSKVYLQECHKGVRFLGHFVRPSGVMSDRNTVSHARHRLLMAMCVEEDPYYIRSVSNAFAAVSFRGL